MLPWDWEETKSEAVAALRGSTLADGMWCCVGIYLCVCLCECIACTHGMSLSFQVVCLFLHAYIYKCRTIHLGDLCGWVSWEDCWLMRCISEDLETSVLLQQWECSDFCGQCGNICITLFTEGIQYHKLSVPEDKCLLVTVMLVVILVLIPFFYLITWCSQLTT